MNRLLVLLLLLVLAAASRAEDLRLELQVVPELQRYEELLTRPGYLAIALENNDLSPSQSSKLKVLDHGAAVEIRSAVLRFTERKQAVFQYEAAYRFGVGDTRLAFPVAVDTEAIAQGKVTVVMSPPLANLVPAELLERIRFKIQVIANTTAQKKVVDYLDRLSAQGNLRENLLLDGYNRAGVAFSGRDAGEAPALSYEWLLIATLVIWAVMVPAYLFIQRAQRRRAKVV